MKRATPKQRIGLTTASLIIGHGFMAASHQGVIGAILATAAGVAAWQFADEVFDKLNTGEPSAPPTRRGAHKTHGIMRKLLTTREQRRAYGDHESHEEEDDEDDDDHEQKTYKTVRRDTSDDDVESAIGAWGDEDMSVTLQEASMSVKTFRQLLEDGTIIAALKQGKMILGYVGEELRTITIKQLYSCGIGGVSGMGKSTTVRFLLFQFALLGARLVMIDPHIGDSEESLADSFKGFKNIHAISDDIIEIDKRVVLLMHEFWRRKEHGIKGPPLILVVDELNGLMRRLPSELRVRLSELILTLEGEARKFGMFCMLIGQRWSEQDLGGKPYGCSIRDSLASTIAHRFQSEDQAKKLIGSQYGRRAMNLRTGQYLFRDTQGEVCQVQTPNTLASDAVLVQRLLDQWRQERAAVRAREQAEQRAYEMERAPEERTAWDAVKDQMVMPERAVQTGPLDEGQEQEEISERPTPVMPEKGPRAEDIDLSLAIELWNKGYNSDRELARVFRMTKYQGNRLASMIKEQVKRQAEDTSD